MEQRNNYKILPVYHCNQDDVLGFEVKAMIPVTTLQDVRRQLEFIQKTIVVEPDFATKKYFLDVDATLLSIKNIYLEFIVIASSIDIVVCLQDDGMAQEHSVQSNLRAFRRLGIALYLWKMSLGSTFSWDGYAVDYLYLHASEQLERLLLHFIHVHDTPLIIKQVDWISRRDVQRIAQQSHMILGVMFR
jgi:hypothetical protein